MAYKLVRYIGGIYMIPKFGGPGTVVRSVGVADLGSIGIGTLTLELTYSRLGTGKGFLDAGRGGSGSPSGNGDNICGEYVGLVTALKLLKKGLNSC